LFSKKYKKKERKIKIYKKRKKENRKVEGPV
jgi:hypothetical protein